MDRFSDWRVVSAASELEGYWFIPDAEPLLLILLILFSSDLFFSISSLILNISWFSSFVDRSRFTRSIFLFLSGEEKENLLLETAFSISEFSSMRSEDVTSLHRRLKTTSDTMIRCLNLSRNCRSSPPSSGIRGSSFLALSPASRRKLLNLEELSRSGSRWMKSSRFGSSLRSDGLWRRLLE